MMMRKINKKWMKEKGAAGQIFKIKVPGGGRPGEVNSLWGVSIVNSWCKSKIVFKESQESRKKFCAKE